ncbi:MAG: gliding motility-associated C-terminal domain-containing protein [Saprospiraceae bacterium]
MKNHLLLLSFLCLHLITYGQTPFVCTGDFYITLSSGGSTSLNRISIDPSGNATFTNITSGISTSINGIGYRSTDNLIYGVEPNSSDLYQIDANGTAVLLTNLGLNANNSYIAGDVTPDGNFLVLLGRNGASNEIVKVDLNSASYASTSIPLINSATGTTNTNGTCADIAFNPITGVLYGYNTTNDQLVTIDINTGVMNTGLYPTASTNHLGALFFDPSGNLLGYGAQTGSPQTGQQDLVSVDINTGATTYITSGPSSSGNDGCSCPYTLDVFKEIPIDTVRPCETFEVKYAVVNTSGVAQSAVNIRDTFPAGFAVTQILNNPFSGITTGLNSNILELNGVIIPLGTDTLVVQVRAGSTAQGTYSSNGYLRNLPVSLGGIIASDDPSTLILDDATPITVIPTDLGEGILACNNTSVTIGINPTPPINGVSYSWNTGETSTMITVNQTGDYILTNQNGTCLARDTIAVTFMDTEADLGNDTSFCVGGSLVLDGSFPNITNYLWNDGSTNSTLNVNQVGTYWVEITDSLNCIDRDTIVVTNYPLTQVDLGNDLMYVCDSTTFTIYPNYTTGSFLWSNNTTNSTFIATNIGTYSVEYTDVNTCVSNDTITLFAPPIPTVNIGIDTVLCNGDSLELSTYQGDYRSAIWQDGSTDSVFMITDNFDAIYFVEMTDTNGCLAFDTISITSIHVFTQLREDTSICHSDTLTIDATQPNVTYLWSTGETTNTIDVNVDTAYWVELTDGLGCHGYDTFNLFHHPVADLGNDIEYVCDSIFYPLDPDVTHGTFLWQNGSTDSIFIPTSQGTYWVEITDTNNCYSTDTVYLIPVTSPQTDIGVDTNICFGQPMILDATTDFIRHYYWNGVLGTNTFNVITTDEYIVEVVDSNGCNAFDTAIVWVNQVVPDIGVDTLICDLTQITLDAAQPNMIAYLWQDGTTNTTFVADTGLYHVTLTDTLGCQGTDSIFIDYRMITDLGSDFTFICDSIDFSLSANISGTYLWNTGETDSIIIHNQEGTYYVDILDDAGCFSSDTIVVTQVTHPTVDLGIDTNYCFGLTYLLDATEPFVRSYVWQDSSLNNTFLTNSTGLYHVELTDSFGCKAYDSVMVWVNEVVVNLGNDTTLCHDSLIVYDATQPDMTYVWQDGSTNPTFTAFDAGTYFVTLTDTINCTGSDTVVVSEYPVIDLGLDLVYKCDSTTFTVYPNLQTGNFLWQNGTTNSTYTATQSEQISVIHTNAANCVSYDTMLLFAPPIPPIDLGNDTILCGNVVLPISIFDGVVRSYLWQDGSMNDNFTISTAGVYFAEITDTNGCTNSDTIFVDYFLSQQLELGNDTTICENIQWQISLDVENAVSYQWQDGTTGADYLISNAGTYVVNVMDINDCTISDTVNVDLQFVPIEIIGLPNDTTICKNNVITLSAFSPHATDYLWQGESAFYEQNDITDTIFTVTYPGTYELNVSNRCAGLTQFVEIFEEDCGCYPFVPNVFTPNNDGRNDVFEIYSNCVIQDFELSIYDRWGNRVFMTTDLNQGWDGTIRGEEAAQGVYVWQMIFTTMDESGVMVNQIDAGDVTLIR